MANNYNSMPVVIDTDITNWGTSQTLQTKPFGLRVYKIALYVGAATSSAGTVTVTEPNTSINLVTPMIVAASTTQNTTVYSDNPTQHLLFPSNFAVTGVTATGTKLLIWYRT
jgi:hypothetical protein